MTDPQTVVGRSFLRRHAALAVATTALVVAGAFGYTALADPVYTAHARVLVEPLTLPTAVQRTPDMGTEAAITTSGAVLTTAAARLRLTVRTVSDAVGVTVPPNANVLDVAYSADDPDEARDGAAAVAASYMAYRARTTDRRADNRLAAPGVQTRLVTSAARPSAPSSPDLVVDVLAGLVVGLVASVGLAFGVDRFGRRLRTAVRWQEATGVPVVVGLPTDEAFGHGDVTAQEAVRYLRTRIGQVLPATAAVLLVAGIREQPERSALAGRLARSFTDAGRASVLVEIISDDAHGAGGLRARVTGPRAARARSDADAAWRPATVTALLADLERLRSRYAVVVVTVPAGVVPGTALDFAAVADTVLLVDHVASSRRDDAVRAVAELRGTGCGVCGCVLLGLRGVLLGDAAPADVRGLRGTPVARSRPRPGQGIHPTSSTATVFGPATFAGQRTEKVNGRTT